jgi:hypothetical protein
VQLITKHIKPRIDIKVQHKHRHCWWIVEEDHPFSKSDQTSFKDMILGLQPGVTNTKIGSNYYSIITDHWTSIANDNYGCLTVHFIDDFPLCSFVLSFKVHKGGCSGDDLAAQLWGSLNTWQLPKKQIVALVTDLAGNMNKMGDIIMSDNFSISNVSHAVKAVSTEK